MRNTWLKNIMYVQEANIDWGRANRHQFVIDATLISVLNHLHKGFGDQVGTETVYWITSGSNLYTYNPTWENG